MTLTFEQIIALVIPAVLGLVWLLRLEGRINVTDTRYAEILGRLQRIEDNQDRRERVRV